MLIRPGRYSPSNFWFQKLNLQNLQEMALGIVISVIALVNMNIDWNVWKVLVLIATYICGCSVIFGLFVLSAGISIYTVENLEFLNIFTKRKQRSCILPYQHLCKMAGKIFHFRHPSRLLQLPSIVLPDWNWKRPNVALRSCSTVWHAFHDTLHNLLQPEFEKIQKHRNLIKKQKNNLK